MRGRIGAVLIAVVGLVLPTAPAHAGITAQIIGGNAVDAATVPWTVALLRANDTNAYTAQFCGATLIDPSWILTAAHCVVNTTPSQVDVAWGITDLNAITAANRHGLSQIIVHPQYNAAQSTSDVALLKLTTPVPGATTLALNTSGTFPVATQVLDTYGWGNTLYPATSYPNLLHGVALTDMGGPASTGACGFYGTQYIGDHMLCAGVNGGGKDACQGDSGGPLVATNGLNQRVLVGVTSWGNGCAVANYPGLWSRVSSYADWIDQQIHAPATPRVYIGNATVTEGDTGNRIATFTVTVSPASTAALTVPYATVADSAISGTDYVAKSGALAFNAGVAAKVISIPVRPDPTPESTEAFQVQLGTPTGSSGATLANAAGVATILDDDSSGANQLTLGDATVREGDNGTGSIVVRSQVALSHAAGTPFTVTYQTVSGTAGARDFTVRSGTLSFTATATVKTISIPISREWIPEGDETFTVTLGVPSTGSVTLTRATGTFTIVNDD